MLKTLFAALIILLNSVLLMAGEETKTYNNKDFSEVSVCCGMKLRINKADKFSIEVSADQKDFQFITVEQKDNSLNFYINKNNYRMHHEIRIQISMPDLKGLALSGGAKGNINMTTQGSFSADLSGGAILIGNLNSGNIKLELSGGSNVNLKGSGNNSELSGSGGSTFELKDFAVKDTECELSGGTHVDIKMNGTLNSSQSGGSQVVFYGTAKIGRTSFSGGSGVSKGD